MATQMSAPRCPGTPSQIVGEAPGRAERDAREPHFAATLVADERFVAAAQAQGSPARRFRFAPACVEGDCAHWSGEACGLLGRIARLLAEAGAPVRSSPAYDCTIRNKCRWREQRGDEACGICGFVVTEPLDPKSQGARKGCEATL